MLCNYLWEKFRGNILYYLILFYIFQKIKHFCLNLGSTLSVLKVCICKHLVMTDLEILVRKPDKNYVATLFVNKGFGCVLFPS